MVHLVSQDCSSCADESSHLQLANILHYMPGNQTILWQQEMCRSQSKRQSADFAELLLVQSRDHVTVLLPANPVMLCPGLSLHSGYYLSADILWL